MASILLLPGMDGTGELFRPFLRALPPEAAAAVVAYPTDRVLDWPGLADLVARAAPAAEPYVVVAESYSGPVGILHAAERPKNLRGLVLVASFARNPLPASPGWLRALARPALFRLPPPRTALRAFLAGRDAPSDLLDALAAVLRRVPPEILARRLRQILDGSVEESLPRIEVPVLYLAGSADRLVGVRGLAPIRARLPGLRTVTLEGPHLLLQARPLAAAREILRFAAEVGAT